MEDSKIVTLFFERDEAALKETSQKYGQALRSISYNIVNDRETAEECENDTYLEAWNTVPPSDPSGYLFTFLARIIRHISIDVCRSRGRQKRKAVITELTAEMEECIPSPDDTTSKIEQNELGKAISSFLRLQSEEKQIIFLRRYWYTDSVKTIARSLGLGESNVKMTLMRLRNALKDYLLKEGYDL